METSLNDILAPIRPGERFHPHTIPLYLVDRLVPAYGLEVFVETGTYLGHTVEHVLDQFKAVFTIELDQRLAENARWKFEAYDHVCVNHANSAIALNALMGGVVTTRMRALIWLDAHWSGGITARQTAEIHTPIIAELEALKCGRHDHVLMVDDIDDFNGERGYPTREELIDLVKQINFKYRVEVLPIRRGVLVALPPI